MKRIQNQNPVKAKPQRRRRTKSTGPSYLQGELRDLPPAKSVAESQAEREAFFERAWAQKWTREATKTKKLQKIAQTHELNEEGETDAIANQKKLAAEQRLARVERIVRALSDSDSE